MTSRAHEDDESAYEAAQARRELVEVKAEDQRRSVLAAYEAGVMQGRAEGIWLASVPKPKHPRFSVVTKSTSRPGFSCSHCGSTDPGAA